MRSASMRVFEGLWWKISSLLGWVGMYSYSNSRSNSSLTRISLLFSGVKRVLNVSKVTEGSVLCCSSRFSGRGEGAIMW